MEPSPSFFPFFELWIIILLTICNGFFALTEIALVSVKKSKIETLAKDGNTAAKTILKLLENPEQFLSSVQVGITLIGIVSGAYGGQILGGYIGDILSQIGLISTSADTLGVIVAIALITYLSIVVGELIPKSLAMRYSEAIALRCVPTLRYFMFLTYPFVWLLSLSTNAILGTFGITWEKQEGVSEDELIAMLHSASQQGVIDHEEKAIHNNLFSFADQTAKSLLTHRSQIELVDLSDSKETILQKTQESSHSRFLVVDGSIDQIVGIFRTRDLVEIAHKSDFDIRSITSEPILVGESTSALKILNLFKKKKQYFAVVVDEHGGTSWIITLHDLIEVIVGDLPDEDELDWWPNIIKWEGGWYLISGSTPLYEINQFFETDVIEDISGQYSSIAGYVGSQIDDIPKVGDCVTLDLYTCEIVDMDGIKIDKLLFQKRVAEKIDYKEIMAS